jgi:type IV pilus assembly protein PilX
MNISAINTISITQRSRQQGAALVVGLIVLLVMTMLGVASMGSMTSELRMAANVQIRNTAFQAASAAIEDAKVDPGITWLDPAGYVVGAAIATQPGTYNATDSQAQATIVFSGCKTVVAGDSLTAEGGSQFLVHEIQVTGDALGTTSNVIGTSTQSLGLITVKVASC